MTAGGAGQESFEESLRRITASRRDMLKRLARGAAEDDPVREALGRVWSALDNLADRAKKKTIHEVNEAVDAIEALIDAKIDERLGQR